MASEVDLSAEWRGLRSRDYAQDGIPVILGVETVGAQQPCRGEGAVADEFGGLSRALMAVENADPAAIIEIVAARELRRLG